MGVSYNKKNMEDASSYYKGSGPEKKEKEGESMWEQAKGLIGLGDSEDDAEGEAIKRKMDRFNRSKPVGLP